MANRIKTQWSEWGCFGFDQFMSAFRTSDELMHAPLDGVGSYLDVVDDMVADRPGGFRYSDGPGLATALTAFANRTVPHRIEDFTGRANVYNPHRDTRVGARPSVPRQGPDVFKPILDGDENGHAIVADFDQDTDADLDDLASCEVESRPLSAVDAHAVSIVNRFPAYVRVMDPKLVTLLDRIGFVTHDKVREGRQSFLRSIPHGINLVTFPFEYAETLSVMSVYDLCAVLGTTQRALRRVLSTARFPASGAPVYDVFFNVGSLAGGTIPRIHMQVYVRTQLDPLESYSFRMEGRLTLKDFAAADVPSLRWGNRSWVALAPPVRDGRFDIRFELKHERKEFLELSAIELWDLAELLVYHSNALDQLCGIAERNIQFLPAGVIFRPFAVEGGHEKIRDERIYGQPATVFSSHYNRAPVVISRAQAYRVPGDARGAAGFRRLVDETSPVLRHAA